MLSFIEGPIPGSKIFWDGEKHFFYSASNGFKNNVRYCKCVVNGCDGTSKFNIYDNKLIHLTPHDHVEDKLYLQVIDLKKRIRKKVIDDFHRTIKSVFDEECTQ